MLYLIMRAGVSGAVTLLDRCNVIAAFCLFCQTEFDISSQIHQSKDSESVSVNIIVLTKNNEGMAVVR